MKNFPKRKKLQILFLALTFIYLNINTFSDLFDEYVAYEPVLADVLKQQIFILKSKCDCKLEERLVIRKQFNFYNTTLVFNAKHASQLTRIVAERDFKSYKFTCGLFNSIRRGENQKVISLTGVDLNSLDDLIKHVRLKYPDWLIRIYYSSDSFVKLSTRCYFECLSDEANMFDYYDNIDFCFVNNIIDEKLLKYIGLADSYVDYYMYRGSDLMISDNEVDLVNKWIELDNSTLFITGIPTCVSLI